MPPRICAGLLLADEKGIAGTGGDFLVVAADTAAKRRSFEIVFRPGRFPRLQEVCARGPQRGPFRVVGEVGVAQMNALAGDDLLARSAKWESNHVRHRVGL
jgi:hypothetical protein